MKIKHTFFFCLVFAFISSANAEQKISYEELEELRKHPDTSKTEYSTPALSPVPGTSSSVVEIVVEQSEVRRQNAFEDPNRPGQFISERDTPVPNEGKKSTGGIVFGEMTGKPMSEGDQQKVYMTSEKTALYSGNSLDQSAMRIAADCEALNTVGQKSLAVVSLGEEIYVIPAVSGDLPPMPGSNQVNATVLGVDVNSNCVRDDVEHYIFQNYGNQNQAELRSHLYAYAIWLRFFLTENISQEDAYAVTRQLLKTGLCLSKKLGDTESERAETEVFALMHDTKARTERYFANESKLDGFDVDVNASPSC